ncbi:MAG: bifunctional 2-methylcitrate dehydratase/aconitate hydratase [Gammaproteobacteria bacterium]
MTALAETGRFDFEIEAIADYVIEGERASDEAYRMARYCLMDAFGCAVLALGHPECTRHLGPLVAGTLVPDGARVPGTRSVLDPVTAAFDIGILIRWLDYNDTFLAAEWGHPSDNLGGLLAVADWQSRARRAERLAPIAVHELLTALIQAYEVQGCLALENGFNRVGLDHVLLVKLATAAVATRLLGGDKNAVMRAISHVFVDGHSLRTYRQAPNVGPRKSWAAGDATSRGVWLALMALKGDPGCPTALSAAGFGFYDVLFGGRPIRMQRAYGSYIAEHILFKVAFPAEFHAQTAAECALCLHPEVRGRVSEIERIEIATQAPAMRIISKKGRLENAADRDHCLEYIVAVCLLYGELSARHYEDEVAADARIDALRDRMVVGEDPRYSRDYLDPERRSIPNAVQVFFRDGGRTERVEIEFPLGHPRRRAEALPRLVEKFHANLATRFPAERVEALTGLFEDPERLFALAVDELVDRFLCPAHSMLAVS